MSAWAICPHRFLWVKQAGHEESHKRLKKKCHKFLSYVHLHSSSKRIFFFCCFFDWRLHHVFSPFSVRDSVVERVGSPICRTGFALAFGWAEGESFDETAGETSRFLAPTRGAGSRGRVIVQVSDVLVWLAEARVLLPVSPAEQELCATPEEAHCDTRAKLETCINVIIWYICADSGLLKSGQET